MKDFFKRACTWLLLSVTFGGAYLHSMLLFMILLLITFLIVLLSEWPRLVPLAGVEAVLLSLLYPGLPMIGLLALHCMFYPIDFYLPLYPFAVAWTADTFGYLVGKICGWHKICPSVSPGKSWQGLAGSVAGVYLLNWFMLPKIEAKFALALSSGWWSWMIIFSVAATVIAFLGGFLLSILKRSKNLKDAGNILPGHGGFLDRFDSVFAVVLVVWIMLLIK